MKANMKPTHIIIVINLTLPGLIGPQCKRNSVHHIRISISSERSIYPGLFEGVGNLFRK